MDILAELSENLWLDITLSRCVHSMDEVRVLLQCLHDRRHIRRIMQQTFDGIEAGQQRRIKPTRMEIIQSNELEVYSNLEGAYEYFVSAPSASTL